ncbi:MAG: c-type cytochrome [Verrucomicrobia bacterium]|nr:c-type cytochrome [Verrucomicrobiota bacterium]
MNSSRLLPLCIFFLAGCVALAQIPKPDDAPQPLPPERSAALVKLPPGFRMELVASEPLIHEASGICWDERGRLFVCELHGYNLEGQLDIEELNKTGQLDREVRRIQADDRAKKAAEAGTYGTVKLLLDTDGDGRMDKAVVWADHLPPCYGLCAARGGVIVACAPDIVFLADRDGDGKAEVRETLFTGFTTGMLERGISCPQWGIDGWIYVGHGRGGTITGPHLKKPVDVGTSDFRIKPDGSAIEKVNGATHTMGFAITETGERFVVGTSDPGHYIVPLPWRYLARNPDVAAPRTEEVAGNYVRVFPIAPPHPWRTKRAQDPGFSKFYRDRYGEGESAASGYFTSVCSPLVYQDTALPGLRGQYFGCEPAQNFVYRALIERDGPALRLRRPPGEEAREFLASGDPWFHPMNLGHAPDGAIWIADFYREIIEDYSAIPRYLQQQYGLTHGMNHGRIWRLVHEQMPKPLPADMSQLNAGQLAREIASPRFWRRETARRLLTERGETSAAPALARLAREAGDPAAVLNALYALDGLGALQPADVEAALKHRHEAVRLHALRFAERWLDARPAMLECVLAVAQDADPSVQLQLALTLGESQDPRVPAALARLAREHGDVRWMESAIASSAFKREREIVTALVSQPGRSRATLEALVGAIAARGDLKELEQTRAEVGKLADAKLREFIGNLVAIGIAEAQPRKPGANRPSPPPALPTKEQLEAREKLVPVFVAALGGKRDVKHGRELFREHCSGCHLAKGLGASVGPDLDSAFDRAEETLVRDILFPSENIRQGFEPYWVQTSRGDGFPGVLASESPTSVTLKLPGGDEITLLRRKLAGFSKQKVALMPWALGQFLEPDEAADIIAFIRQRAEQSPKP